MNLSYICGGDYILISGTNRKALLYTKEGISIGVVAEQSSWIWSCQANLEGNKIVYKQFATNNDKIECLFETIRLLVVKMVQLLYMI